MGNKKRGNTLISISIILVISVIIIIAIGVFMINSITPFIWYEKLNNISLKYMFVIEKYGYLTDCEKAMLLSDLKNSGFDITQINIIYPTQKKNYGDLIEFSIKYNFIENSFNFNNSKIQIIKKVVPLEIKKYSYCKN